MSSMIKQKHNLYQLYSHFCWIYITYITYMGMQIIIRLLDAGNIIIILLNVHRNQSTSKRKGGERDHGLINLLIS